MEEAGKMKHSPLFTFTKISLRTVWIIFMTITSVVAAYPLIFSFLVSLSTKEEVTTLGAFFIWPSKPNLNQYRILFVMSGAIRPALNSFMITAYRTILNTTIHLLGGYLLARYEFKAKKPIIMGIIIAQVIPGVLTMMPSFILLSRIPFVGGNNWMGLGGRGLINNPAVLYVPLGWGVFLGSFLCMQSIRGLPRSFEEAAEIDGYGFWKIIITIIIPMQAPILAVLAIGTALGTWNDWMTPFLYLNNPEATTLNGWLGTLLASIHTTTQNDYPAVFALANLAIIPPLLLFLFFQRYIIQGIASVGIKE
jgi:multiple sugar transport system permease protein